MNSEAEGEVVGSGVDAMIISKTFAFKADGLMRRGC
jgi:hypothetical protein